jgi:hypothetical protein
MDVTEVETVLIDHWFGCPLLLHGATTIFSRVKRHGAASFTGRAPESAGKNASADITETARHPAGW